MGKGGGECPGLSYLRYSDDMLAPEFLGLSNPERIFWIGPPLSYPGGGWGGGGIFMQ